MRTDKRAHLLRDVDDGSPALQKALWHAITALEDIAYPREFIASRSVAAGIARRALDAIEHNLPETDA